MYVVGAAERTIPHFDLEAKAIPLPDVVLGELAAQAKTGFPHSLEARKNLLGLCICLDHKEHVLNAVLGQLPVKAFKPSILRCVSLGRRSRLGHDEAESTSEGEVSRFRLLRPAQAAKVGQL